MPQIVSNVDPKAHAELKKRAKANFRTVGNQLLAEAFGAVGLPVPDYVNKRQPTKRTRTTQKEGAK